MKVKKGTQLMVRVRHLLPVFFSVVPDKYSTVTFFRGRAQLFLA
jgi:hypothetical protein